MTVLFGMWRQQRVSQVVPQGLFHDLQKIRGSHRKKKTREKEKPNIFPKPTKTCQPMIIRFLSTTRSIDSGGTADHSWIYPFIVRPILSSIH